MLGVVQVPVGVQREAPHADWGLSAEGFLKEGTAAKNSTMDLERGSRRHSPGKREAVGAQHTALCGWEIR